RTLASLEASWKAGYEPIEPGSILVIDEVGMVGTRQLARVTAELHKRGCKLVLVGDPDQLQPIEAGTPFRDLLSQIDSAALTEIRRQRSDWQKQASISLAQGKTDAALAAYSEHGRVQLDHDGQDAAIAALAEDYWVHYTLHGETTSRLALAHRRRDVFKINQSIRALLIAEGEPKEEVLFDTETGPRAFATGDRIVLTRNNAVLDVRNGMLGTVAHVDEVQITIHLDAADGNPTRKVKLSPSDYPAIDHGYATTIHKSQGATVDHAFVLRRKLEAGCVLGSAVKRELGLAGHVVLRSVSQSSSSGSILGVQKSADGFEEVVAGDHREALHSGGGGFGSAPNSTGDRSDRSWSAGARALQEAWRAVAPTAPAGSPTASSGTASVPPPPAPSSHRFCLSFGVLRSPVDFFRSAQVLPFPPDASCAAPDCVKEAVFTA
ncbi:MAG: AAA family ATPase, partial [Pseudomonadota bacterium]|nr:AAA family ATPase [Pseudomonadota bacterium]